VNYQWYIYTVLYLHLPFETSHPPDELPLVPLVAGTAKACRDGISHSLLTVLIVSNVPMLEDVEVEEALGLPVPAFLAALLRLRFGLPFWIDELVVTSIEELATLDVSDLERLAILGAIELVVEAPIEDLGTLDVSDLEALAILGAIEALFRMVSILGLRLKVFSSIFNSSSLSLCWQMRRSSQSVLGRGRAKEELLLSSNNHSVASMAK